MQGWVKLHRKIYNSHIFHNEKLLKVFVYCLLKASHKEFYQAIGRQKVKVEAGQFIFGRKKASEELNMKESTVWAYMKYLKDDNTINIDSNNKYSLITVVNWGIYQSDDENYNNNYDSSYNNKRTTNGQQTDTYKNVKNIKNNNIHLNNKGEENNNNELQEVNNFYQDNIGVIGSYIAERIIDWYDHFGKDIMLFAIELSIKNNKKTWAYIETVLRSWEDKKLTTIDQVKASELEFKERYRQSKITTKVTTKKSSIPDYILKQRNEPPTTKEPTTTPDEKITQLLKDLGEID